MDFREHFEELNDEQKAAASHIDGSLLVIAGPGTGKTQLLSNRVAYILENTDTKAKNILCLTFTNKAALNMQERIISITNGGAHDVSVRTFHSFASEIMSMYPDYFWNNARLSTAPDAVQDDILQSILSKLPLSSPLALKFAGKFTVTPDVKQALKLTKEAGLTPEKLRALIEANLAYIDLIESDLANITSQRLSFKNISEIQRAVHELPVQNIDEQIAPLVSLSTVLKDSLDYAADKDNQLEKTSNTSEWKRQWIQTINGERGMFKERAKNEWWLQLADVYEDYRRQLHVRGYYDYSDMLVEVLTQIETHPEMRADIQERYLYVMIDEFQDTNAAQLRLAHLVADHYSADGKPNIMAVGDDDQSIFKFNGAELNNLLSFKRSYPSARTIVLTDNYRSNQAILDLSEKVIAQAEDRLVNRDSTINKHLEAKNDPGPGEIAHYSFKTNEEQLSGISRHIKENFSPGSSVAVIARGHESLRAIAARLVALDVPVHYEQQQNILDHALVKQAVLIAEISCAIHAGDLQQVNSFISSTLKHPMWGLDAKELWNLALSNMREPDWLSSLENSGNETMEDIAIFFMELAQISADEALPVIIEYLLGLRPVGENTSPIHLYFTDKNNSETNDYLHGLSAMQYLRNLSQEFSPRSENATLQDFVDFVRLQRSNGSTITDESPFVSGENAVSLLSVHKAKGLEFDTVYVIDAVEKNWEPRKGGRKPPSNLPLQPTGDDIDDYIRLMFVAITRAKKNLYVSSYRFDRNNSEVLPSPIIASVLESTPFPKQVNEIQVLEEALTWPRLTRADEKLMLKRRLDNYSLSVTHLLNFLDIEECGPEKYLERNILCLPSAKTSSLAHGTAMHCALEHAQKLVNAEKFDLDEVKKSYVSALKREHLPHDEEERYMDHGRELLERLFSTNLLELKPGSAPEQSIKDVRVGDARLQGTLDRIEPLSGHALIVSDYKTGSPLPSFETKNQSLLKKAWKQRTQLIFYALLLKHSPRIDTNDKKIIGQMLYLNADSPKEFSRSYEPSGEDIARLKKLTQAVWKRVINMDLPDTQKYPRDFSGIQMFEEDLLNEI